MTAVEVPEAGVLLLRMEMFRVMAGYCGESEQRIGANVFRSKL